MQVLPFMPSLELYPRNSLPFSFSCFIKHLGFANDVLIRFQLDGDVKEERRRLRRVVLDSPIQRSTLLGGAGDFRPLPPGEGGVSRAA